MAPWMPGQALGMERQRLAVLFRSGGVAGFQIELNRVIRRFGAPGRIRRNLLLQTQIPGKVEGAIVGGKCGLGGAGKFLALAELV